MPPSGENGIATSEELRQKFIRILEDNGITDEVKEVLIREPIELQGEHMATATVYAEVKFKNESVKSKNLFVKKFANNETHTEMIKAMRIMEKESSFFNDFLPTARQFCKDNAGSDNLLDFFPKCLYGDDTMVVLENVVVDDEFIMLSKAELQDEFTAKVVLGHLATFHAVTHAMVQKEGIDAFKKKWELNILESFDISINPFMDMMFDNGINTCNNIVKMQGESLEDADFVTQKLTSYIGKVGSTVQELYTHNAEDKLRVLNHGDCWNNNMLFKKDPETGKVSEHIFVDLQITRLGSPTLDIGYFMFTSVKRDLLKNKTKELLKFFYDEFNKTADLFGLKCPLTYEEFLLDYKRNCAPGFYVALSFLSTIGALKEVNMDDFGADMEAAMNMFTRVISEWIDKNPDEAKKISCDIASTVKLYEAIQADW